MAVAADPFTAAFSSFAGGFGKSLGDGLTGGGGPFVGGSSAANSFGTTQDGSGWVVNIQGRQDTTQSLQRTATNTPNIGDPTPQWVGAPSAPAALAGLSGAGSLLLLGIAAGFILLARKRKG